MTAISTFDATTGSNSTLVDALVGQNSGIVVNQSSITVHQSAVGAINLYDGTLGSLGIGSGLLLTSGTTPETTNTVEYFGTDNSGTTGFENGDADINAVVNTVFQTQSYDATTLEFDFTVTDPTATSVTFDIVFGSDEYPEWVDLFVDSAIVTVNGVNYALFNHDPNAPLSVISSNLASGYFQDNAGNVLQIEYDGVSQVLKIVAPINSTGVNHIKIGIADTGDHILDSGIFISNLTAGNTPGSGVVIDPSSNCSDANDDVTGSVKSEVFNLKGGDDTAYSGGGDDIVIAGAGQDKVYGGSGADVMEGDEGDDVLDGGDGQDTAVYTGYSSDYLITKTAAGFTVKDQGADGINEGTDDLSGVELLQFKNGLFQLQADGSLAPVSNGSGGAGNAPGSIVITGVGAPGNTLTAALSDADGISGAVSYTWQLSTDGGSTWIPVGTDSSQYIVGDGDAGALIEVTASYTDGAAQAELVTSGAKDILSASNGDLHVTLMQLTAPAGASVMNPLTTLVQACIDLGLTPNLAEAAVKSALGLPSTIKLASYDAYAILQQTPNDNVALNVEKVAVQVAVLTSLSDDDHGVNLALKIIDAAANGQVLNLADENDLSNILGVEPGNQPLDEILDRNLSLSDAVMDGQGLGGIEKEWQDLLSVEDGIASSSIADLSVHINQAPKGYATFEFAAGQQDSDYTFSASDLLQGFSDPDGDEMLVANLTSDSGYFVDNGDGTFTFVPAPGFSGPVEFTYTVEDINGASAPASQMLVIAAQALPPDNQAPALVLDNLVALTSENGGDVKVADLSILDDGIGSNDVYLDGADAAAFELVGGELHFVGGADYEQKSEYNVQVVVDDPSLGGGPEAVVDVMLAIDDVNEAPTLALDNAVGSVDENGGASVVADISVSDDMMGDNALSLSGADASSFAIVDGQLMFLGGANFEGQDAYNVTVNVDDSSLGAAGHASQDFSLTIDDVNEAPTLALENTVTSISADAGESAVADIVVTDDALGANLVSLGGPDASAFKIAGGQLVFVGGPAYQGQTSFEVTVNVDDASVGDNPDASQIFTLTVAPVNLAPTVALTNPVASVAENGGETIVADVLILDDGLGVNDVSLVGADAASFKLVDDHLVFLGGANFEAKSSYDVLVTVADATLAGGASSQDFTLAIADVNEGPSITSNGGGESAVLSLTEGETSVTGVSASDPDANDMIDYAIVGGADAALFTIDNTTGALKFAAGPDFNAPTDSNHDNAYEVVVQAMDAGGLADIQALTVNVTAAAGGVFVGDAGANVLDGTAGNDTFRGMDGADTANGYAGADVFVSTGPKDGADQYDGGEGSDTVDYSVLGAKNDLSVSLAASAFSKVEIESGSTDRIKNIENVVGGAGDDEVKGDSLDNMLDGRGGKDQLAGNGGNDTLIGGYGKDEMSGGVGDDTFVATAGDDGADDIDGGSGVDTVDYSALASSVAINVTLKGASEVSLKTSGGNTDTIKNVENVIGGAGADKITGDSIANALYGNGGADTLSGGGGSDRLDGGAGLDKLTGGAGNDVFVIHNDSFSWDTITDFTGNQDKLEFDLEEFGLASFSAANFAINATGVATDGDDYLLFNTTTKELLFDADGAGGEAAVHIATLNVSTLAISDILFV